MVVKYRILFLCSCERNLNPTYSKVHTDRDLWRTHQLKPNIMHRSDVLKHLHFQIKLGAVKNIKVFLKSSLTEAKLFDTVLK